MPRAALAVLLLLALPAPARARSRPPSRAQLAARIDTLQGQLDALRKELAAQGNARAAKLAARLDALEKQLAALRAAAGKPDPRIDELENAVDELRDEAVTPADLHKYVRKPNEREFKSRVSQELELRMAFVDLRQDEIQATLDGLSLLAEDPTLPMPSRAIIARVASLTDLLLANDARARPRLLLRLYWETNRFLDERHYLFVNAEPELELFVYATDFDRVRLARDVAAPRQRLGFIFKKAAAGVQLGRLGLQAGVLQFTYGAGFFENPTNPFTPKDPLDPRREVDGVPAARLDLGLVQGESFTLTAQVAGVAEMPRNDILGLRQDKLGFGGFAMLRADTQIASLTGIGIYRAPDDLGRDSPSVGGIVSLNPFGLTLSAEALWTEAPYGGDYRPELVASLQGFTSSIGKNGTTYILEYAYNGHLPTSGAEAGADVLRAVTRARPFLVVDRLTRPLGRRQYANVYLEPSLTTRLKVNLAALIGFDEARGALLRGGFDYELFNLTIHAFAGALVGQEGSEFNHHFLRSFAELAVFASF